MYTVEAPTSRVSQHVAYGDERLPLGKFGSYTPTSILWAAADRFLDKERAFGKRTRDLQLEVPSWDVASSHNRRGAEDRKLGLVVVFCR